MELIHKEKVTAACACRSCVNKKPNKIFVEYKGKLIYFCNEDCKEEFYQDTDLFFKEHFKIKFEDLDDIKSRLKSVVESRKKKNSE